MSRGTAYALATEEKEKALTALIKFMKKYPDYNQPDVMQEYRDKAAKFLTYELLYYGISDSYDYRINSDDVNFRNIDNLVLPENIEALTKSIKQSKAFDVFLLKAIYGRFSELDHFANNEILREFRTAIKNDNFRITLAEYDERKTLVHKYAEKTPEDVVKESIFNTGVAEPKLKSLKDAMTSVESRYNAVRDDFAKIAKKKTDATPEEREMLNVLGAKMLAYRQIYSLLKKFPKDIDLDSIKMVATEEQAILRADALKAGGQWDPAFKAMMSDYYLKDKTVALGKDSISGKTAAKFEKDFQVAFDKEAGFDKEIEEKLAKQEKKRDQIISRLERSLPEYERAAKETTDNPEMALNHRSMAKVVQANINMIKAHPEMPMNRVEAMANDGVIQKQAEYLIWSSPEKLKARVAGNNYVANHIKASIDKNLQKFGEMEKGGAKVDELKDQFVKLCVERKIYKHVVKNAKTMEPYSDFDLKTALKDQIKEMKKSEAFNNIELTKNSMSSLIKEKGEKGLDEFNKLVKTRAKEMAAEAKKAKAAKEIVF